MWPLWFSNMVDITRVPPEHGRSVDSRDIDGSMQQTIQAVGGTRKWVQHGPTCQIGLCARQFKWVNYRESKHWRNSIMIQGLMGWYKVSPLTTTYVTQGFIVSPLPLPSLVSIVVWESIVWYLLVWGHKSPEWHCTCRQFIVMGVKLINWCCNPCCYRMIVQNGPEITKF
jgi:hypothetical protein